MIRAKSIFIPTVLVLTFVVPDRLRAQEGTWQISASTGIALLQMSTVNAKLDRDVEAWNLPDTNRPAIPIGPFEHFKTAQSFSVSVTYRSERDVAFRLGIARWSKSLTNSYADPSVALNLDRSVEALNVTLGILYYLQPLRYSIEPYAVVEIGSLFAEADATTYSTVQTKVGPANRTDVLYDTKATYKKSKLSAVVGGGATMAVMEHVLLRVEALYTLANLGTMDGEIQQLSGIYTEPSKTQFDFSAFHFTIGLAYEF